MDHTLYGTCLLICSVWAVSSVNDNTSIFYAAIIGAKFGAFTTTLYFVLKFIEVAFR